MKKKSTLEIPNPGFSSGVLSEKKVLLAKIILIICIAVLIAAKGFGS